MSESNSSFSPSHPDDRAPPIQHAKLRCACGSCTYCMGRAKEALLSRQARKVRPERDSTKDAIGVPRRFSPDELNGTPLAHSDGRQPGAGETLQELLARANQTFRSERGRQRAQKAVEVFQRIRGDIPAIDISEADVTTFADELRSSGASEATIAQHVQSLGSLVRTITPSPDAFARYLRSSQGQRVQVRRYSPLPEADLHKLLNAPQFVEARDAGTSNRSARFWMPLLALLTGARGAELTHLTVNDIRRNAGSWELSLGSPTGPRPWGQMSRNRWIPMSAELIACGFLTFAAQCKLAGKHHLFVSEATNTTSSAQIASINAWLGRLSNENGVSKATLASLRCNFIVNCIDGGLTVPQIHFMLRGQLRSWVPLFGFSSAGRPVVSGGSATELQGPFQAKRFNHLHVADAMFAVDEAYTLSISP